MRIKFIIIFILLVKLRKRYKCKAIDSEKIYLFNPLAVIDLEKQ